MKINKTIPLILLISLLTSCGNGVKHPTSSYGLKMNFHDDFTIMQLTDIHLGVYSDYQNQIDMLRSNILSQSDEIKDPDLIILTGDTFMNAGGNLVQSFFHDINKICDELSNNSDGGLTKFAYVHGNHDKVGDYPDYFINEIIKGYISKEGEEKSVKKYAAFIDYQNDDIYGDQNYYIDLVNGDDIKYRLTLIDSNSYHYRWSNYGYDVIHDDQLAHIENAYKEAKDKDYIGLAFFHIPLSEYKDVMNQYESSKHKEEIGQGEFRQNVNCGYKNNNALKRMRSSNIIGYFAGHDHLNYGDYLFNAGDKDLKKKAVLSYGVKSTDQIKHAKDIIGCKVITLKETMSEAGFLSVDNIKTNIKNYRDWNSSYGK